MTDLDKIKACARAMEIECDEFVGKLYVDGAFGRWTEEYDPLKLAHQADALEGWLLERGSIEVTGRLFLFYQLEDPLSAFEWKADMTVAENRRRARVECAAKMMEGA